MNWLWDLLCLYGSSDDEEGYKSEEFEEKWLEDEEYYGEYYSPVVQDVSAKPNCSCMILLALVLVLVAGVFFVGRYVTLKKAERMQISIGGNTFLHLWNIRLDDFETLRNVFIAAQEAESEFRLGFPLDSWWEEPRADLNLLGLYVERSKAIDFLKVFEQQYLELLEEVIEQGGSPCGKLLFPPPPPPPSTPPPPLPKKTQRPNG